MSRIATEEGMIVAPGSCHITPDVPTELLKAIIAEREGDSIKETEELYGMREDATLGFTAMILATLKANGGRLRIKELEAETLIPNEAIKALAGAGFVIASGGWVKLNEGGEA
jgi:hypothetical protein